MGMEKYEAFVRRARTTLVYDPGWSEDNKTGAWRALRPVLDPERCNQCDLCWLYCPDACIARGTIEIDYTYCKGCGICVEECHRGALKMEREGGK
jgi:2-oxoacid:acceptor oxidoreductase delta subunit (pyruvate/2-ketoisovalerate family)